jgi:hypothetical protein
VTTSCAYLSEIAGLSSMAGVIAVSAGSHQILGRRQDRTHRHAAHPMLQYLAQGACQALEDAACLAELAGKHPDDWDAALAGYAEIRTARTARVQRTARQWGDLWHCDGLFRATRNALLTDRDPADYRYTDWLYAA